MDERYLPYVVTEVFCAIYALAIFLRLQKGNDLLREEKCLGRILVSFIIMVATDAASVYVEFSRLSTIHFLNGFLNGLSLAATMMGCFFWFEFVEMRISPETVHPKWVKCLLLAPAVVLCIMDTVSAVTGWVYYIGPDGHYREGSLFWMQNVIPSAYLLIPTVHALCKSFLPAERRKREEYFGYAGYAVFGFASVWLGDIWEMVPVFEMSVLLAAQFVFMTLYLEREHRQAVQEIALSESRTAIVLSQIQPHFLYNTLTVIQEMCGDKAPEAAETTVQFAEFLRGNLSALTRSEPVSFEQELSYTKVYLALEQKRFGSRLKTEYDIQATHFQLPALTLQPLAENAVQHGISERPEGGTLRISSKETEKAYLVILEDDGIGFDPEDPGDTRHAHIGIENVRKRLEIMCGGTLAVQSTKSEGTVATITIPKVRQLP